MNKQSATYFVSSHGIDIGKVYNLPKDVRVLMICESGKLCSAGDDQEALLWEACFTCDDNDVYMDKLHKYCVYSGNTTNANRVPDLILEEEPNTFFSGVCQTPFDLNVIMTHPRCSTSASGRGNVAKVKEFGEIKPLDKNHMIELLHNVANKYTTIDSIPDEASKEFLRYFIRPHEQNEKKIKDLRYLLLPKEDTYYSFFNIAEQLGKTHDCNNNILNEKIKIKDVYRTKDVKVNDFIIKPGTTYVDIPRAYNEKEKQEINTEVTKQSANYNRPGSIYLSELIAFLCNKNSNKLITIVISACRGYPHNSASIVLSAYKKEYTGWYPWLGRPERNGMKIADYKAKYGINFEKNVPQTGGDRNNINECYFESKIKYQQLLSNNVVS
jgi:hypothetical protein